MSDLKKSNSTASRLRNEGNTFFGRNEYFKALLRYNHSLCFAETGTDSVGLALANRSAAYLKLELFEQCLENIELAKKFNYPAEKMDKLEQREEECEKSMVTFKSNPDDDPSNYFKLSYGANKKFPEIVDCLELRQMKTGANFMVTTRDLKPGDIISMSDALYSTTYAGATFHRCSYCLKDNSLNLMPCHGCSNGE